MNNFQFYALHGFLGLPSDWDFFEQKQEGIDLYDTTIFRPQKGLSAWGKTFNSLVENNVAKPKALIGYSLGGRLALHALIDQPNLWDAAVIVSAHPGMPSGTEKRERRKKDLVWAKRFLSDPWEPLMNDWNSQTVFSRDTFRFPRKEEDYSRKTLASVLEGWSLANQEDLRGKIQALSVPILWIAGEFDKKFASIACSIKFSHPKSKVWIASEAGHSVPWQKQEFFEKQVETFLENG